MGPVKSPTPASRMILMSCRHRRVIVASPLSISIRLLEGGEITAEGDEVFVAPLERRHARGGVDSSRVLDANHEPVERVTGVCADVDQIWGGVAAPTAHAVASHTPTGVEDRPAVGGSRVAVYGREGASAPFVLLTAVGPQQ